MTDVLQVEHKNEPLQTLKEKLLTHQDVQDIAKQFRIILNEEYRLGEDLEKVKSEFRGLHLEFFNHLQQTAAQKLTSPDLNTGPISI